MKRAQKMQGIITIFVVGVLGMLASLSGMNTNKDGMLVIGHFIDTSLSFGGGKYDTVRIHGVHAMG